MRWLPVLFVLIPFTELVILLEVGESIGAMSTIGVIITTALIGYALFKHQGFKTWQKVQQRMAQGEMPSQQVIEGMVILVAGALMITPGLITDVLGLFCLLPFTRKLALTFIGKRIAGKLKSHTSSHFYYTEQHVYRSDQDLGRTFEGDFTEEQEDSKRLK